MTKKDFDINVFLSNIEFFCEKSGKKIGELERETGVSTGYFSRIRGSLTNDKPKIPKVHVALAVAKNLHVPLDILATVDFSTVEEEHEKRNIQYVAELVNRTNDKRVIWEKIPLTTKALREMPGFEKQKLQDIIYPIVGGRDENVVLWSTAEDKKNVFVVNQNIQYMRRNDSTIYFIEGFYVPKLFVSGNLPPSRREHNIALWLHTKDGKNFCLMNAEDDEEDKLFTMLSSLRDSINANEIQTEDVAQEVADEIDSLLKESAFNWGV